MKVEIINTSSNPLPKYETISSAGLDLRANLLESILVLPGETTIVPTGLFVAIPQGYEIQIRPRSGLAAKHGITVLNSPGTIDSDYRGEIKVILINHSNSVFDINNSDRIAQAVLKQVEQIEWEEVTELSSTDRGVGGFGHTGQK